MQIVRELIERYLPGHSNEFIIEAIPPKMVTIHTSWTRQTEKLFCAEITRDRFPRHLAGILNIP